MSRWNHILFIYNPNAGRGQIRANLHGVLDILSRDGSMITVHPTQRRLDAYEFIRNLSAQDPFPFDVVVVSGGDGTLHEVVNGLMEMPRQRRVPVGYIPAGSTNDFATSHTIPRSITKAAENINTGKAVPYDIGRLGSSYFSYVAAFGSFVDVSYDTPQDVKNAFGHFAYIMEGAKRLNSNRYKPMHIKVSLVREDGTQENIDTNVVVGLICNTYSVGGYSIRNDAIDLHDGCSDLALIQASDKLADYLPVLTAILQQNYNVEGIIYRKIRSARFISEEPISWTLDGEFGGNYTDIDLETCHDSMDFIVSEKERSPEE